MTEDNLTESGAHRLAARIRAYWATQQCHVKVRVVNHSAAMSGASNKSAVWVVRSDIGAGLPARIAR